MLKTQLFFLFVSAIVFGQDLTLNGPRIQFQDLEYDYGKVKQYTEMTHAFPFSNTGTETLMIKSIDSGCTCSMATASATEIKPGEDAEIIVTFNTNLHAGKKKKTVLVYTNDPNAPQVPLIFYADVQEALTCYPAVMDFGLLEPGAKGEAKKATLQGYAAKTAKIIKVVSENPLVQARLVGTDQIEVSLLPGLPVGRLNTHIQVETDQKDLRLVEVLTVSAKVKGNLSVVPQLVDYEYIAPGQSMEKEVVIKTSGKKPFKILKVTANESWITSREEVVQAGKEYKVFLKATQAFKDARVIITTDDPAQKEVKLTLFGKERN